MGTNNKKKMAGLFSGSIFFIPNGGIHPCPLSPTPLNTSLILINDKNCSSTNNDGPENDGARKLRGGENAGPANDGPSGKGMKMPDLKMPDPKCRSRK